MIRNISSLLAPILALGLTMNSRAANVLWNCFWQSGDSTEFEVCWYDTPDTALGVNAWAYMNVTTSASSAFVTIKPNDVWLLSGAWNWVVAEMGEIACEATTQHLDSYFIKNSTEPSEAPPLGDPVTVAKGTSVYMMVMAEVDTPWWQNEPSTPPYLYGWVELQVGQDGVVRLASSALDLDGGPMIVGGGSATPEPSTLLLLLIGGAALALRRKTGSSHSLMRFKKWRCCRETTG